MPAFAQNVQNVPGGLPQDWSHRHLIYATPATQEELEATGNADEWSMKANDPRFVGAFERRERLSASAIGGAANAAPSLKALAKKKRPPASSNPPLPHRDWTNVMGGASGVGGAGIYPAKYNFGVTTKDCANDFVVFTTNSAGATGSGTFWTKVGTFTGVPAAGGIVKITNALYTPAQVLSLTASSTSNVGLNFLVGTSAAEAAANLAQAIARNGSTVGVMATSVAGAVTISSITTAVAAANITATETLSNFTFAPSAGGTGTPGQATIFALNYVYADTANGGCQTATQAVPATMWAYTTGAGAIANTSPVISLDGDQVAFVQHTGTTASLVLLKWSARASIGTIGAPTAPTSVAAASFPSCAAPCMTVLALSGNPNDTNSSPFYDYANDVLYVGADDGTLHKFTGVFGGTPAEVASSGANVWPAAVSSTALTSPVFDSTTNRIFVGSARSGSAAGTGALHAVDSSIGSGSGGVTSSGQLFVNNMTGTFDAPIVDSSTHKVYVFVGDDFSNAGFSAVYQFDTATSLATQTSPNKATVSGGGATAATTLWSGGFDDTYYAGVGNGGFLYVCGFTKGGSNPTPIRIGMSGTFGASVTATTNDLAAGGRECSPATTFGNNGSQYLFLSVAAGGNDPACNGACVYAFNILPGFDATSTSSTADATNRFMSVSTSTALSTTEASVATTLTSAQAGMYSGMTITQGANSPAGTTFRYTLRQNAGNTPITCTIGAGNSTCSDATHTASFGSGDAIDVLVVRSGGSGTLTTTFRVRLDPWPASTASAGLAAPGGAGGIIIDNSLNGGGSQIYYSTRTSPGLAVQASQAGLN